MQKQTGCMLLLRNGDSLVGDEFDEDYEEWPNLDENWGVMLNLDPETRIWEMRARGTAAMLMFLLVDASEGSVMQKLLDEAKFDQVVKSLDGP